MSKTQTAEFTIKLTPNGVECNMKVENIGVNEAIGVLVQGSERIMKHITEQADLQITNNEKGNN